MNLQKISHLGNLLGCADKAGAYAVPAGLYQPLLRLPKTPHELEGNLQGYNIIHLTNNNLNLNFFIEVTGDENKHATLYLREEVHEIGGMHIVSYITPIAEYTSADSDTFIWSMLDAFHAISPTRNETDIALLDGLQKRKAARRESLLKEQERLSRAALPQLIGQLPVGDKDMFDETLRNAKPFSRFGKTDYYKAQIEIMESLGHTDENINNQFTRAAKRFLRDNIVNSVTNAAPIRVTADENTQDMPTKQKKGGAFQKLPADIAVRLKSGKIDFHTILAKLKVGSIPAYRQIPNKEARAEFDKYYEEQMADVMELLESETEIEKPSAMEIMDEQHNNIGTIDMNSSQEPENPTRIKNIVTRSLPAFLAGKAEVSFEQSAPEPTPEQKKVATQSIITDERHLTEVLDVIQKDDL